MFNWSKILTKEKEDELSILNPYDIPTINIKLDSLENIKINVGYHNI